MSRAARSTRRGGTQRRSDRTHVHRVAPLRQCATHTHTCVGHPPSPVAIITRMTTVAGMCRRRSSWSHTQRRPSCVRQQSQAPRARRHLISSRLVSHLTSLLLPSLAGDEVFGPVLCLLPYDTVRGRLSIHRTAGSPSHCLLAAGWPAAHPEASRLASAARRRDRLHSAPARHTTRNVRVLGSGSACISVAPGAQCTLTALHCM
jgi:hypothetical protein